MKSFNVLFSGLFLILSFQNAGNLPVLKSNLNLLIRFLMHLIYLIVILFMLSMVFGCKDKESNDDPYTQWNIMCLGMYIFEPSIEASLYFPDNSVNECADFLNPNYITVTAEGNTLTGTFESPIDSASDYQFICRTEPEGSITYLNFRMLRTITGEHIIQFNLPGYKSVEIVKTIEEDGKDICNRPKYTTVDMDVMLESI